MEEKEELKEYYQDTARLLAIVCSLREISIQLGISESRFESIFDRKVQYYMMKCLQKIEDKGPSYAAALQLLSEDEISTDVELPHIFDLK